MTGEVEPGRVLAERVTRSYKLFRQRNFTLKSTILTGRRAVTERFVALRDVSFEVPPGGTLGIVGANGSGKSTLLRVVAGILRAESGTIRVGGQIASLLELGAGFHPEFSGRDNVYMNGSIFGLSRREIARRFDEIVAFAELERFIDQPVKTYSSGMQARLGFSVAAHVDPNVLLLDEVLSVGDAAFQRKCFAKILDFKRRGTTLLFVSHDAGAVERLCENAILLDHGTVKATGPSPHVLASYNQLLAERHGAPVSEGESDGGEWGTRRAVIEDLLIHDGDERPKEVFRSGSPFAIDVTFRAAEVIERPVVRLQVREESGATMWSVDTVVHHAHDPVGPGVERIRYSVESLPLHQGRFDLTASLHSSDDTETFHWFERRWTFSVFPVGPGAGLVAPQGEWRVVGERAALGEIAAG